MNLYGSANSPYTRKVRIVLAEKGIDCSFDLVSTTAPDTQVTRHNPLGKVPVIRRDDGTTLFDSRVIVEFLDNVSPGSRLIPEEHDARIAVRRWEALADGVLDAGILIRYELAREAPLQSSAWIERQMGKIDRGLAEMARELADKPWCHGHAYSLADVSFACCLGWLAFRFPEIDWRAKYPNLARHFDRLLARPAHADTAPKG
ncbi:MAG: glutathione S-transferase C-terminal domain-containing protein [Pseudomonadota bacterium]